MTQPGQGSHALCNAYRCRACTLSFAVEYSPSRCACAHIWLLSVPTPQALRAAIGNFYLVLRGLDTVEDDMENFADNAVKVAHLRAFHTYLKDSNWHLTGTCVVLC